MPPLVLLLLLTSAGPLAAQFASERFVSTHVCSDCHSRLYPPGLEPNWFGMTIVHRGEAPSPIDPRSIAPYALWPASTRLGLVSEFRVSGTFTHQTPFGERG